MAIQIGAKLDSGFDDPIGMLKDCHRRIEHFLDILCVVAERAHARSLTGEEQSAVKAALQYFYVGGERHTADEEESLFPRLRKEPSAGLEEIEHLERDHHIAAGLHESVDRLYTAWSSVGALQEDEQHRLLSQTRQLQRLYSEHIQIEETIVFPRAVQVLDGQALAAIQSEFIARRRSSGP
jgi:hemerythrin-like domain-containing protein